MAITTNAIRNIAMIGHGGTGKTSLTEQILFAGGAISKFESVDTGRTVSDYADEEKEKGISIHSTLSYIDWDDCCINIFDTPGSADFVGEVVSSLRASEMGVMVVDAKDGVQIETIKLWRRLESRSMPRIVFINKQDKDGADYQKVIDDLRDKFDTTFVPVTMPIGEGADATGVVNLITNKAYVHEGDAKRDKPGEPSADMADMIELRRMALIESAAEGDDALMEKYFAEETLSEEEILQGLKSGLKNNVFVPVFIGSAEKNIGVTPLLEAIAALAPSPAESEEKVIKDGEEITVQFDSSAPFASFSFKTSIDQFSGKLSFMKIVNGILASDTELYNVRAQSKEKSTKVYKCIGKKLVDVSSLEAGDIGIVTKIESLETNDSLTSPDNQLNFEALKLPQPVHMVTINAESKKNEDKMNQFLQRAAAEDKTFSIQYNKETHETVIGGMGELHLNMILDRIREGQKIGMVTKVPRVAYRETVTKSAEAEYTHKKQSGGHGQYGRVVMTLKPLERGKQYEFTNAIKGGSISKGYMPGIEKGLQEGMLEGYLAGYPIVDLSFSIIDGKEHPVDSSEMAFKLAAKGALKAAMEKAHPVLLEPVMNLRVFCNDSNMGDVLSDLSSRRGRVMGQEDIGGGIIEIDAQVPQAELMRYAIDLKSITSGTASFEVEFDHYDPISGKIAETVIKEAKAAEESND